MSDMYDSLLNSQNIAIEKEYNNEKKKSKNRRKYLEMVAEKTCNFKYAVKQLGGPNQIFSMNDIELRDFVIKNILEQKSDFMEMVKDLQGLYLQEEREKMELANTILSLQNENEQLKQNAASLQNISQGTLPTSFEQEIKPISIVSTPMQSLEAAEAEEVLAIGGKVWNIAECLKKVDLYQEEIIKTIGEFGYSETRDIFDKVMATMNVQETTLKNKMLDLIEQNILETEGVSTFLRRNLDLYSLTVLGEEMFISLTNKKPMIAEKNKLKTQHSSLKHAYCIKDTTTILERLGYTNISMDSSVNQIQVAGSNRYIPDIVANFDENKKTYWEVELAHHKDSDFFEKLQKAAKVTDTVYVIAPDKAAFDKLKNQIGRYKVHVMSKGFKTNLTIFVGTMNHLSKRELFSNENCKVKIG